MEFKEAEPFNAHAGVEEIKRSQSMDNNTIKGISFNTHRSNSNSSTKSFEVMVEEMK
jgi:hypothetical protein